MAKQKLTADQDRGEAKATPGGGIVGMIGLAFMAAATVVAKVWEAVMADGTIAASGRMGLDEIGAALKAFPDSLQCQRPARSGILPKEKSPRAARKAGTPAATRPTPTPACRRIPGRVRSPNATGSNRPTITGTIKAMRLMLGIPYNPRSNRHE